MDSTQLRVDQVDVRQAEDELTLILGAAGVHIMLLRLHYDGWVDEVINGAGSIAPGPGAWTLIGHDLCLEFGKQAVAALVLQRHFVTGP